WSSAQSWLVRQPIRTDWKRPLTATRGPGLQREEGEASEGGHSSERRALDRLPEPGSDGESQGTGALFRSGLARSVPGPPLPGIVGPATERASPRSQLPLPEFSTPGSTPRAGSAPD